MNGLLVLDFDGTITDAELEGSPFRRGYLDDLAVLTGLSVDEVDALAAKFEAEVAADPQAFGWVYDGRIVAPATVDPYLRMMPVARKLFDHCGAFPDDGDRTRLCDGILYKYNYQKTLTAFRDHAAETLRGLTGTTTYVVTNSHTEPVRNKLRELDGGTGTLDWLIERVHGRAKKYVVDASFDAVDAELNLPGLDRPVLLRRRLYHTVLSELLERHGLGWSDLTVVGDIFELDLALPIAMGARVGLVVNQFTPDYEKAYVGGHERGWLLQSLDELSAWLG